MDGSDGEVRDMIDYYVQGLVEIRDLFQQKKAESATSTPSGTPRKWDREERGSPVVVSSDEEPEVKKVNVRPRQRSLKRKRSEFTNQLTSEQLVS